MRRFIFLLTTLAALVLILPFLSIISWNSLYHEKPIQLNKSSKNFIETHSADYKTSPASTVTKKSGASNVKINVYIVKTNQVATMPLEQYITGVVAAEMPIKFQSEALKAQAVAARTYALSKMKAFGGVSNETKKNADVCTDPKHCQSWISESDLKVRWGKDYAVDLKKVTDAVNATAGEILTYNGKLIQPVFHSTSGGKTESALDAWGKSLPYLVSVVSPYEQESPKLKSEVVMSKSEFVSKLKQAKPNANVSASNLASSISITNLSKTNRIKTVKIGNITLTGDEFRSMYNLNSTEVKISYSGNNIVLNVIGYGHGVGMSQYGAQGMAEHGYNYQAILKHYYTGVDIADIDNLKK